MRNKLSFLFPLILFCLICLPAHKVTALESSSAVTDATATKTTVSFKDVAANSSAASAISSLAAAGYVHGYPDGLFHPDDSITRAEFIAIANQVFTISDKAQSLSFADVKYGDWYYDSVAIATNAGYIAGFSDGKFHPQDAITREQVCVMIDRLANLTALPLNEEITDPVSPWALSSVKKAISNCMWDLEANNTFRAKANATRGEVCLALSPFIYTDDTSGAIGGGIPGDTEKDISATIDKVTALLQNKVLPKMNTAAQREIINDICDSMESYQTDKQL